MSDPVSTKSLISLPWKTGLMKILSDFSIISGDRATLLIWASRGEGGGAEDEEGCVISSTISKEGEEVGKLFIEDSSGTSSIISKEGREGE